MFSSVHSEGDITRRISEIRCRVAGDRGKAKFAKMLGISPSTYDYYESSRVPPASVLLKIAELGSVDIRWLISGQHLEPQPVSLDDPILQRAASLIGSNKHAAHSLANFLELLAQTRTFPAKDPSASTSLSQATGESLPSVPTTQAGTQYIQTQPATQSDGTASHPGTSGDVSPSVNQWIPILGRTAAGVPSFWQNPAESDTLPDLLQTARDAVRSNGIDRRDAAVLMELAPQEQAVQIITLRHGDESGIAEFLAAPAIQQQFADAFALRVDGDSMSPDIRHGDLVVLSPSGTARNGRPAVVQLRGQIGVTCKLFRREGRKVHLAPINERLDPISVSSSQVVWALRVLARVRG